MKPTDFNISKEKLQFAQNSNVGHDQKLETKPIGYFKDAWLRFRKNKASIVAAVIIIILVLFAIIVPIFSKYQVSYADDPKYPQYKFVLPKSDLFTSLGVDFWDGCKDTTSDKSTYLRYNAIMTETGLPVIKHVDDVVESVYFGTDKTTYYYRYNTYYEKGVEFRDLTYDEYKAIQEYQDKTGIQVIYPAIDTNNSNYHGNEENYVAFVDDANMWFVTEKSGTQYVAVLDKNGNYINMYLTEESYYDYIYDLEISSLQKSIDTLVNYITTYVINSYNYNTYQSNEAAYLRKFQLTKLESSLKSALNEEKKNQTVINELTNEKEIFEELINLLETNSYEEVLLQLQDLLSSATSDSEKSILNNKIEILNKYHEKYNNQLITWTNNVNKAKEDYTTTLSKTDVKYPSLKLIDSEFESVTADLLNYAYETGKIDSSSLAKKIKVLNVTDIEKHSTLANTFIDGTRNDDYNSIRVSDDDGTYMYAIKKGNTYRVRVCFYEYYIYYHKVIRNDGVTRPYFLFGTTDSGQDILTCLASGARFSLILAVVVATVNLVVGAIIGAIEGYYGGKIDLIIERIVDILSAIPFMIVITLLKYHLDVSHIIILFISFFLTGWIGMAGRTRMQFYRFKNQEYVLVARTLGASDKRIMFKHIFPNAIGTLITSCVLVIPGVIFSETSLSYLGIINLDTGNLTSVGTLLAKGNTYLFTYPHIILTPALFISLLELSFNLFGNGLRDAFNPSLRGTEE